jgi:uncharacterized protein DUF3592
LYKGLVTEKLLLKLFLIGFRMVKEKPTMAWNAQLLSLFIVLAAAVCLAILFIQVRKTKIRKQVTATVITVEQEREERGNAEYPRIDYGYYIEAEWIDPQTGDTYRFRSNRLASSPKEYTPGTPVHILIDPKNPARYALEMPEYDV